MRSLLAASLLALTAAACGPSYVPVEVDWTFNHQSCHDAGVAVIQIDIDNEILTPNRFTCQDASLGADLGEFLPGPYTATITGFDSANNVLYQSTQVLQVRRGVKNVFPIDVASVTGDVSIQWTFAGKSCSAAGVSQVRVSIDGQVITDANNSPNLPCSGATADGTVIGPLSSGNHTVSLAAHGSSSDYALDNVAFNIAAGSVTTITPNLLAAQPTTASADLRWTFAGGKSCADVGVDHIYVVFDPQPNGSNGTAVADTNCAGMGGPVTGISIVDVPDGYHSFAIRGTRNNQLLYYTHKPVQTLFSAPFTTTVDVTAEALP